MLSYLDKEKLSDSFRRPRIFLILMGFASTIVFFLFITNTVLSSMEALFMWFYVPFQNLSLYYAYQYFGRAGYNRTMRLSEIIFKGFIVASAFFIVLFPGYLYLQGTASHWILFGTFLFLIWGVVGFTIIFPFTIYSISGVIALKQVYIEDLKPQLAKLKKRTKQKIIRYFTILKKEFLTG